MRDGRFFHAVWLCSACILPAGRRMWDTLFSHDEPSRLSGGDGRKRQTKKNCRPNRGPGLVASLLYSTIWRQVRYVRICWCGVVSLGEIPISDGILSVCLRIRRPAGIKRCCHSPAVRNVGRQAARQQTGAGVFAEAGGWSSRWARKAVWTMQAASRNIWNGREAGYDEAQTGHLPAL